MVSKDFAINFTRALLMANILILTTDKHALYGLFVLLFCVLWAWIMTAQARRYQ